jgi:hypothetical protein
MRRELERGSWSLVGLLIAAVIMILLFYYMFTQLTGVERTRTVQPPGAEVIGPGELQGGDTSLPGSIEAAKSTQCKSNLRQIRLAIEQAVSSGQPASSLSDLSSYGVTSQITKCPAGGEQYVFDPQAQSVHCPHPGHEGF